MPNMQRDDGLTRVTGWPGGRAWVAAVAGLATVVVMTLSMLGGPIGLLPAWLGGAAAAGGVVWAAGDRRAGRVAVLMVVLLPATVALQSLVLWPVWSLAGPWAAGAVSLAVTAVTPAMALVLAGPRAGPGDGARSSLGLRAGFAACTAAVIVTGHLSVQLAAARHGALDGGFFTMLLVDLAPAGVYFAGARHRTTALVAGFLLFLVVSSGWAMLKIEGGNQFAGLWVFYSWVLAAGVAVAGTIGDLDGTRLWWRGSGTIWARQASK